MRKYFSFFRLRFSLGLQYRVAALAGIVTQFAWGFLEIMLYRAFYEGGKSAFPMTFQATVSYIWLQQAFLAFFAAWMMENDIFEIIINGDIAYELCRPVHIYHMWYAKSMATRISRAVLRCFPILIVAFFLPKPFTLMLPEKLSYFIIFIVTLILGLLVTVAFCMLVYILAFFTISPQGLRMVLTAVVEFFSGAVLPLPFFPDKLRIVMECLPFASMQNVALRIYGGGMSDNEIVNAVLLQVFWLFVLVSTGKLLCRIAEKRVSVQGG